jgi:hypothetical protein
MIRRFVSEPSPMDLLWEFAGRPSEATLIGSGTDLDLLGDWATKASQAPGVLVVFNEKALEWLPCADLVVANRAHSYKILLKKRPAGRLVACLKNESDGVRHGEEMADGVIAIRRDACPILDFMAGWVGAANDGEIWRLSAGFYSCAFLKNCDVVRMAGFDGYMKLPRKTYRWHEGIKVNLDDKSSKSISGKHHDYGMEFALLVSIAKAAGTRVLASLACVNVISGIEEWTND